MNGHGVRDIAGDLEHRLGGKVISDELRRTIYSRGAYIYRPRPMLMGQFRHREGVVQCPRYAAFHGSPVIFSEPSCVPAVKQVYPRIVDSAKALKGTGGCFEVPPFLSD